jgi:TonB-like protein
MAALDQFAAVQALSAPDVYTWTFPGAPLRIFLHLGVVERLGRKVSWAFEPAPLHGVEIGGLLLGTADRTSHVVEVKDFEPFSCEDRDDHKFILSVSDRYKLADTLAAHRSTDAAQLKVVGYYRSHTGEGLRLGEQDVSLTQSHFCDPANVVLLVKPSADGSSSAGFFFWDNGRIESEFTFLEFPFDAEQLRPAQVQPLGLAAPEQRAGEEPVDKSALAAVSPGTELAPAERPPSGEEEKQPARTLPWQLYWRIAVVMIALGIAGYSVYMKWAPWKTPSPVVSAETMLDLKVGWRENNLYVSWSRNLPVLDHAKEAVLSISDGEAQMQNLRLEPDQLRNGSVVYAPTHSKVQFRLEIAGDDGRKISETVIVLTAAKPDAAHGNSIATRENIRERTKRPAAAQTSSTASRTARYVELPPPQSRKTLTLPGAQHQFGGPVWVMPADPPLQTWSARTLVSTLLEQLGLQPGLAPPPTVLRQNASPGEVNAAQLSGAAPKKLPSYVAARPIHQERPQLSRDIRRTVTSEIAVQVSVQIDEAGRVVRTAPVASTGPMTNSLMSATQDAARRWRFMPAMRGNQPVASETVLEFRYRPTSAN